MNNLFKQYFNNWYLPIIIATIGIILSFLLLSIFTKTSFYISLWLMYFSFFLYLVSIILGFIKFFKKNYLKGSLQTIISTVILIFSFGYFSFFLMFYPNDYFADDLEIPKKIKLELPSKLSYEGEKTIKKDINFDLIESFQPGLYEYNFVTKKIDSGYVYLKAFEITKNTKLSEDELKNESKIFVYNDSDSLKIFSTKNHFTIYEGDWGKPYAAKFELWYKNNKTGKEKKILEKNYKIEGWQR